VVYVSITTCDAGTAGKVEPLNFYGCCNTVVAMLVMYVSIFGEVFPSRHF